MTMIFGLPYFMFFMFFVVFVLIVFRLLSQWNKNNHSPRLTVEATIVAKRQHTRYSDDSSDTSYYATFQFESGDRLEMHIPWNQFGYLVEGDRGKLTLQGTRFLGFERN